MATAMTAPAAGAMVEGRSSSSRDDATARLHKDNAIEHWAKIKSLMDKKQVVLFLDYDGTLSPIVDQPDKAFMKEGMRPVLAQAASVFTTAIVTGRSKDKVYNFVGLDDVFYAGSHGLEIQGPLDRPVKCQMAEDMRPMLEATTDALHSFLAHIPGYEIEDNKFSLSVHYRQVRSPPHVEELHKIVHEYVATAPEIVVKAGKKVLELRPKVDWNKGSAVNWILDALDLGSRSDVFPIYLGDDITDEDAFVAMETRACGGMGILVKEKFDPERPPETNASFSLRNPDEVQTFLATLVSHAATVTPAKAPTATAAGDTS
ncbi:GT20 [Ectocarpus sp. CCAP 1310/34]|nr:GT20 [Ectocarpus sp. CCAP 1310/34]